MQTVPGVVDPEFGVAETIKVPVWLDYEKVALRIGGAI